MASDFYTKVQQIDIALSLDIVNPDISKSVTDLINTDENIRDYFLKRVKSIQWFDVLKKNNYFNNEII